MTAYTVTDIAADFSDGTDSVLFPAGIPVDVLNSCKGLTKILIRENDVAYNVTVPSTSVAVFDSPLDMAGI